MMVDVGLAVLVALGFLALFVAAIRRHGRDGQPGAAQLGEVLGVYAVLAITTGATMGNTHPPMLEAAGDLVLALGFGVIPVLMLRFARAFDAVPRWVSRLSVVMTPLLVGGAALFALEVLSDRATTGFLVIFLSLWVGVHGLAAAWLLRGGRDSAVPVARRRAQLMAASVGGLGAIMPLAAVLGVLTRDGSATGILLFAVVVVGLLLSGFAPPGPLRWHWARHDRDELAHVQQRLIESDDPERLATDLLPHVARLAGGSAAWLYLDGEVAASHPPEQRPPMVFEEVCASGRTDVHVVGLDADRRLIVAPTSRGALLVAVHPYALLFGARDMEAVAALAVQLDVAVDRAQLRAQRLHDVRELEAARRIAEVERVRDDVLATVSHEMRTPLTAVCGLTSVMLERWDLLEDEQRRELTARVSHNADDLKRVVEEILDLTAYRLSGPERAMRQLTDVRALVDDVVGRLGAPLGDHVIAVDVPTAARARLDRPAMEQMIRHLLLNALKFSPEGGVVRVTAEVTDEQLTLSVSDQGVGMVPEVLQRAFEPFFRGGDVLRRETRGIGLGLTLVAALADRMGGSVRADSRPNEGTTVVLTVPLASTSDVVPAPA